MTCLAMLQALYSSVNNISKVPSDVSILTPYASVQPLIMVFGTVN